MLCFFFRYSERKQKLVVRLRCAPFEFDMPSAHGRFIHPGGAQHFHPCLFINRNRQFRQRLRMQHLPKQMLLRLQGAYFIAQLPHAPLQYWAIGIFSHG